MGAAKVESKALPNFEFDTTHIRQFVFGPRPGRTLCRVLVWSVLAVLFFHHLLVPIQIIGSSMSPTYRNGSLNLVNRLSYTKKPPIRGDVIALSSEGELLLKRIVALPGETVAILGGRIYIDEEPLADPFSYDRIPWEMDPVTLSADEFFVIGDNRAASIFCKVCKKDILGKTVF
jgi:signal peptidase I